MDDRLLHRLLTAEAGREDDDGEDGGKFSGEESDTVSPIAGESQKLYDHSTNHTVWLVECT